ncbi:hypothetical protein JZ751_024168 [Albula glossodonta]|uniref:Cytosolic beta-glucosidase n=1 Tax=Albula glossodonta TaxID=121402 RepID=A0A8T2NS24_9TELE|nr:hypothetical protein JZ751_024168 [Albula glossodonta]
MSVDIRENLFPSDFAWGAATAAYQVEGGWKAHGKGPSIWDTFCHGKGRVFEDQNGDVACNSYELWEEDLRCVNYYNKVINDLLACNITPMVTLYHFDLPQALQDRGGWKWAGIAEVFDGYAAFCFRTFGDRVKLWLTLNEPYVCAKLGHEDGLFAPGVRDPGVSLYLAGHNMLRAHARAWHSYSALFRPEQKGLISLALNSDWAEPQDPSSPQDAAATERYMAFTFGWFASPVFMTGDYPATMRSRIEARSAGQGFPAARLPEFEEGEPRVLGTADFFALNHYTSRRVRAVSPSQTLGFKGDQEAEAEMDPSWPVCGTPWLAVVPYGLRKLLNYIKDACGNPAIYITENGFAQTGPVDLNDSQRSGFYRDTLLEVCKAIHEDGVDVRGYFAWSLLDNFEWADGFSVRFGLFHVDFTHPELTRTMYLSGREYAKIIMGNGFQSTAQS